MHYKKSAFYFLFAGVGALLIAASIYLATATPVSAQCGSQASSCKNCHEVQAQDSVNADGTGWHQSHAFGDFCYICHAGNNQATDKVAAHEGMVAPLADVKASCQQCHVADLDARAQVYATTLGVAIGSSSSVPASGGESAATPVSVNPAPGTASDQNCNQLVVDDPNVVNYTQNYDEIVLGRKPINWGNTILIGMIALMLIGGGGFIITRERLVSVKFGDTRKIEGEYPADVVDMAPEIAKLKASARRDLRAILTNPAKAAELFAQTAKSSEKQDTPVSQEKENKKDPSASDKNPG